MQEGGVLTAVSLQATIYPHVNTKWPLCDPTKALLVYIRLPSRKLVRPMEYLMGEEFC